MTAHTLNSRVYVMGQPKHKVLIGGVKVTQGSEGDGWFDEATITVEPALRVGPAFVQAVLGRNPAGVKLDEILSDYERNCTVFLGEIALTGGEICGTMIYTASLPEYNNWQITH